MTKKVLITGVSSGIGQAQAKMFLEKGYKVYGIDRSASPHLAGDFHFLQLELTEDLATVYQLVPHVDILCNTAGLLDAYKPLLEVTDQEVENIFAVNVFSIIRLTRHYLSKMVTEQSGIIINMCSIASFLAGGGGLAYTASKHALAGFTKQLALDYSRFGIQVFGIAPGAVKTAMTKADFEEGGMAEWVAQETPIGRWTEPEEIAELTAFLASGKMASMQGEIIKIDGGWSLK